MPVRRTFNRLTIGYGSFGTVLAGSNIQGSIPFLNELAQIPLPDLNSAIPPQPYVRWAIHAQWRVKTKVIGDLPSLRKRYRVQQGFEQFGQVRFKASSYTLDTVNITHADFMSPLLGCAAVYGDQPSEGTIPCDEPPSDVALPLIEESSWLSYSQGYLLSGGGQDSATRGSGLIPCDNALVYFDSSVISAIVGGTYQYSVLPFTAAEIAGTADTVRILL